MALYYLMIPFNFEIEGSGFLVKPNPNKVDLYTLDRVLDFALCLKDYFMLTGYPELIPRYALGIWWNREKIYNFNDAKALVKVFNRNRVPFSVLLLSEFWHIKIQLIIIYIKLVFLLIVIYFGP